MACTVLPLLLIAHLLPRRPLLPRWLPTNSVMKLRAAKLKLFQKLQRDLRLAKLPSLNADSMKMLQSLPSSHAHKVLISSRQRQRLFPKTKLH